MRSQPRRIEVIEQSQRRFQRLQRFQRFQEQRVPQGWGRDMQAGAGDYHPLPCLVSHMLKRNVGAVHVAVRQLQIEEKGRVVA